MSDSQASLTRLREPQIGYPNTTLKRPRKHPGRKRLAHVSIRQCLREAKQSPKYDFKLSRLSLKRLHKHHRTRKGAQTNPDFKEPN